MTNFQRAMTLVVVAVMFFMLGWSLQPFMRNTDEFHAEYARCLIETGQSCSFVVIPDGAYTHYQFLYASHVRW